VEVIWRGVAQYGQERFDAGHIPGAVAWDYESHYRFEDGDIIAQSDFEQDLSHSGIGPETTVVLYSSLNNLLATFEFWLLKYYGHVDVRLLDGGREKWSAEGRPIEQLTSTYPEVTYDALGPQAAIRADRADVLAAVESGDVLLVDARSAEMYAGDFHPRTRRGGHIPGAVNVPAVREVDAAGEFVAWRVPTVRADESFKSADELRTLFEGMGITPDKEIITYCLTGGLSTHTWFVLKQLLGYPHVREYERSWGEWGNREELPLET